MNSQQVIVWTDGDMHVVYWGIHASPYLSELMGKQYVLNKFS